MTHNLGAALRLWHIVSTVTPGGTIELPVAARDRRRAWVLPPKSVELQIR